jgi:hypothetical protein
MSQSERVIRGREPFEKIYAELSRMNKSSRTVPKVIRRKGFAPTRKLKKVEERKI